MLKRGGAKTKIDAAEVAVPRDAPLARTLLEMVEKTNEERKKLKQKILAAAAEQESSESGRIDSGRIFPIRQNPTEGHEAGARGGTSRAASSFKSSGRLH